MRFLGRMLRSPKPDVDRTEDSRVELLRLFSGLIIAQRRPFEKSYGNGMNNGREMQVNKTEHDQTVILSLSLSHSRARPWTNLCTRMIEVVSLIVLSISFVN